MGRATIRKHPWWVSGNLIAFGVVYVDSESHHYLAAMFDIGEWRFFRKIPAGKQTTIVSPYFRRFLYA